MNSDLLPKERDRSDACEKIEITPEMIEAGVRELALFDPAEDPPEYWDECVSGFYRAMRLTRN